VKKKQSVGFDSPVDRAKEWLSNPGQWSCWPYCPMSKMIKPSEVPEGTHPSAVLTTSKGTELLGVVCGTNVPVPTVWVCNMLLIPMSPERFVKLPKFEYQSIDAMLADGWDVD
jgi:hypothetical protein